jgi:membrane-bound lytic murein transglycosylase D
MGMPIEVMAKKQNKSRQFAGLLLGSLLGGVAGWLGCQGAMPLGAELLPAESPVVQLANEPAQATIVLDSEAGNSGMDEVVPAAPPAEALTAQPADSATVLPLTSSDAARRSGDFEAAAEVSLYNIPIVRDHKVEGHMRFFHTSIRDRFEQWLNRLSGYRPLVERILTEFDLPTDLVYLSLVESGFNPHAYSRARATGPWQFMKGTARLYGLRVDDYVDERRDPIKSTVAAARYLRDLYDLFGTWPLAMAAYNAGEGKVLRALAKTRAESFSEIAQTRHLRRETKEYVPRIMAATIIAKNPDQYGFSTAEVDLHQFEEVVVRRPMYLRDVATVTGIPFLELQRLNPELRRDVTPPGDAEYHLKVPVGTKATVEPVLDRIPSWKPKPAVRVVKQAKERDASSGESMGWYRVRVGDSLWTIAKRFRLSVEELKSRNNLTGRRIKPGDLLAIHN